MSAGVEKQFPMTWEQAVEWLREQPDQEALVRACYFDDPLLEAARRFHLSEEWVETGKRLPKSPEKALDLGAGRGISSYALAANGFEVTALEPDPSPLVGAEAIRNLAAESGLPITVVQEWGERLPFAEGNFSLVHGRQVLHHARNLSALCKEVARVLKPGGVFIATREHVVDIPEELTVFLAGHPLHHLYGGENAFSLMQYVTAIEDAGLLFCEILAPFDSAINYFPATWNQVETLAQELCPGSSEDTSKSLRRVYRTPGRLFTFLAIKQPVVQDEDRDASWFRQALHSSIVVRNALTDNLYAMCASLPKPHKNAFGSVLSYSLYAKILRYMRRFRGKRE